MRPASERQVGAVLRNGRRTPWRKEGLEQELLDANPSCDPSPARRVEAKNYGEAVVERLLDELSPRGLQVFELLFVEERAVEDVMQTVGVTSDVVYAWRSRILKRTRQIAAELEAGSQREERSGTDDG